MTCLALFVAVPTRGRQARTPLCATPQEAPGSRLTGATGAPSEMTTGALEALARVAEESDLADARVAVRNARRATDCQVDLGAVLGARQPPELQ